MEKSNRILITGGTGFLGRVVVRLIKKKGYNNLIVFSSKDYDLRKESDVKRLFNNYADIDMVIHLAGDVGGIGYNFRNPGSLFYNNVMMNTLVQEYSRINNVKKFVGIGSVCEYPKSLPLPFKE